MVEAIGQGRVRLRFADDRSAVLERDEAWALLDALRKVLGDELRVEAEKRRAAAKGGG